MNTPANLQSAANCLIAAGFFHLLPISLIVLLSDNNPDTFAKIFAGGVFAFGLLLWLAALFLYRSNKVGKWIWWVCSPLVLLQLPIGTLLGAFAFFYLSKPDSKAALSGETTPEPLDRV